MVRISSSTVHSSRSASVASATSSVDARADHVDAEHLVVLLVGDDLHEAFGLARHLRAAEHAERERADRARRSRARFASRLGQPDAADLGIAVGAAGHVVVVDRPHVLSGDPLGGDDAFRRRDVRELRMRAGCPSVMTSPIAEMSGTEVRYSSSTLM